MTAGPGTSFREIGPRRWVEAHFSWLCAGLCLAYLALELVYIERLPFVMDEFAGAYQIEQLRQGVPYRDYMPYKTVLGYALQLPWLLLSDDPVRAMLRVKLGMASFVALGTVFVAYRLRRLFAPEAVLLGLLLLFCHSTFLERSAALRVDMLTALFGLVSLQALLAERFGRAALVAGVSLLISQKGAYYVLPGAVCLAFRFVAFERTRAGLLSLVRAGALAALPLAVYWLVFGLVAGFGAVFGRVAVSPQSIAFSALYDVRDYWWQTLSRNPWFYGLSALALLVVVLRCAVVLRASLLSGDSPAVSNASARRGEATPGEGQADPAVAGMRATNGDCWPLLAVALYAAAVTAACIWNEQPWPYFFVLLLPTLAVLLMATLDVALRLPVTLSPPVARLCYAALFGALVLLGCAWPLQRVPIVLERDPSFQRRTIAAAYELLGDEGTYFAGTQLLYDRRHVPGTSWLDKRRLAQVTAEPELALALLQKEPPRILVYSYRLRALPEVVRTWFSERYHNVAGNLFSRVLTLEPGQSQLVVPYSADYKLLEGAFSLDGKRYESGDTLRLPRGTRTVLVEQATRLVVWSQGAAFEGYVGTEPQALFDNVYRY